MYGLLLAIHLIVCLSLVGVVLLQSGKGGGLAGGAFGGSAQTVFGGRGATDLVTRATMVLGGLFFLTSITLALISTGQRGTTRSLIQQEAQKAGAQGVPAAPRTTSPSGAAAPATGAPGAVAPATGTSGPAPAPAPAPATSSPKPATGGGH